MIIQDISGASRLFELKDGTTLRLLARECVSVEDSLLTEHFNNAQKLGFIYMLPDNVILPKKKSGKK